VYVFPSEDFETWELVVNEVPNDAQPVRRKRTAKETALLFCNLRISSIRKLIQGRHGLCCFTAEGETYFMEALPYLVEKARIRGRDPRSRAWAQRWTPWVAREHTAEWFTAAENHFYRVRDKGDQIAARLKVFDGEVKEFKLYSFGSIDRPAEVREAERKIANRLRMQERRRAAGMTPRSESQAALKPWLSEGVSESTWRRRRRKAKADSDLTAPM
jgi:hypothetical protein